MARNLYRSDAVSNSGAVGEMLVAGADHKGAL